MWPWVLAFPPHQDMGWCHPHPDDVQDQGQKEVIWACLQKVVCCGKVCLKGTEIFPVLPAIISLSSTLDESVLAMPQFTHLLNGKCHCHQDPTPSTTLLSTTFPPCTPSYVCSLPHCWTMDGRGEVKNKQDWYTRAA